MTKIRRWLLDLARAEAERYFNADTLTCIIPRETAWYAITLLESGAAVDRLLANQILASLVVNDGTHSPCTLLVIYQRYRDLLSAATQENLLNNLRANLAIAAGVRYTDGNVNHPIAAYVHLICGGELLREPVYRDLGIQYLQAFQQTISGRHHQHHHQAEMAEYNSPTYTALTLWFLALAAEWAQHPEAKELALLLEQGLWLNVAMHWHAPSQQLAGPFSRAYGEDSLGGFSALHCTLACALDRALFIEPALVRRFEHPSALIQNALPAVLKFHVPQSAVRLVFEKPLPYYFRMTTYCEQYHENGVRKSDDRAVPVFDDEVYPGGWGDLTTFLTDEYCLGSASRPYVNAGQSDGFTLRYRRAAEINSLSDFRSLYTRLVFNGATVGHDNFCHSTGFEIKKDYLYEEGRLFTCQHENRAIVCYAPKRVGHRDITGLRLDLIFSGHGDFDTLMIDDQAVRELPVEFPRVVKIVIADFRTYLAILPLTASLLANFTGLTRVWRTDDHLMISFYNYSGQPLTLAREQMSLIQNGFVLLVETRDRFDTLEKFMAHLQRVTITENTEPTGIRNVGFRIDTDILEFSLNPVAERIIRRQWQGQDLSVRHLEVSSEQKSNPLFFPTTLYGKSRP